VSWSELRILEALTFNRMITYDLQRFSTSLAAIYPNLAKPILDGILFNYQLSQNVGIEALVGLTFAVQSTAILCGLSPDRHISCLEFDCFSHSAIFNTSFRYLHSPICPISWITSTCTLKITWVFRGNCFHGRRAYRTFAHWERVCNHVETRKEGVRTTVVVRLCGGRYH